MSAAAVNTVEVPIPLHSFDAEYVCEEPEPDSTTNVATREDVPPDGGYDSFVNFLCCTTLTNERKDTDGSVRLASS